MNVAKPFSAVSASVDADVLVALAGSTRPRTGREVQRLTGRSGTGVRHVLDRLVEQGLVVRQRTGAAHAYTLNRDHLLAPAVEQMADARAELMRRLREAIGSWGIQPKHASLFGSAARGDGGVASDIDVFIVRPRTVEHEDPKWRDQVDVLATSILCWTGNHAAMAEVGSDELAEMEPRGEPILQALHDQAIDLGGQPLRSILAETE